MIVLLEKYKVPRVFDFLSIDIDGEDFWVAGSVDLEKFKPRVVSIEFNPEIPPPRTIIQIHRKDWVWSGDSRYGCSITAAKDLLNWMGYTLVAASGVDAIFIANEEIEKNNLQFKYANNEYKIFSKAIQHLKATDKTEKENDMRWILKHSWYVEAIGGKLEHSGDKERGIFQNENS